MTFWIERLMKIGAQAEKRIEGLKRRLERIAIYPFGDTRKQISTMIRIIDTKRQTEAFYELSVNLKKGLTQEEADILHMIARRKEVADIAEKYGLIRQTAYRRVESAFKTAENVLFLLGYDLERLESDFDLVAL